MVSSVNVGLSLRELLMSTGSVDRLCSAEPNLTVATMKPEVREFLDEYKAITGGYIAPISTRELTRCSWNE